MSKLSVLGTIALSFLFLSFVLMVTAKLSQYCFDEDQGITEVDSFKLWARCYRSVRNTFNSTERQSFVGCHLLLDYLMKVNLVTSQYFYTVTYIGTLMTAFGSCLLKFCYKLNEKRIIRLILILAVILMISSISGVMAALIIMFYAVFRQDPIPFHDNIILIGYMK